MPREASEAQKIAAKENAPTKEERIAAGRTRNLHFGGVYLKSGLPVGRKRIYAPGKMHYFAASLPCDIYDRYCEVAKMLGIPRFRLFRNVLINFLKEIEKTGIEHLKSKRPKKPPRIGYKAPKIHTGEKTPWQEKLEQRVAAGEDPFEVAQSMYDANDPLLHHRERARRKKAALLGGECPEQDG
jgi:hypothetical protein